MHIGGQAHKFSLPVIMCVMFVFGTGLAMNYRTKKLSFFKKRFAWYALYNSFWCFCNNARWANVADLSSVLLLLQSGLVQGIMHVLLLSMSAHLTEQLGMAPGGEFRRAFREVSIDETASSSVRWVEFFLDGRISLVRELEWGEQSTALRSKRWGRRGTTD